MPTTDSMKDHLKPGLEDWGVVEDVAALTKVPGWRIKRLAYANRIPFSKPFGPHGRMLVRGCDVLAVIEASVTPAKTGS